MGGWCKDGLLITAMRARKRRVAASRESAGRRRRRQSQGRVQDRRVASRDAPDAKGIGFWRKTSQGSCQREKYPICGLSVWRCLEYFSLPASISQSVLAYKEASFAYYIGIYLPTRSPLKPARAIPPARTSPRPSPASPGYKC